MMGIDGNHSVLIVESRYKYDSRHLKKPKAESFRGGAFKVRVDGKDVGFLPTLEVRQYVIEEGFHTLQVRLRWYKSPMVRFKIGDSEAVSYAVSIPRTALTAVKLLLLPWRSVTLTSDARN
jgi:hypothetical protein